MNRQRSGTAASRLSRCMKAPVRMLCRACDFYVRRMNSCAGRVQQGGAMGGYPTYRTLPRTFSTQSARTSASSEDDLRELVRAASVARMGSVKGRPSPSPPAVPRSQSVAIGRIDEDEPCEFEEDAKLGPDYLFPRSRSYAVAPPKRRRAAAFV